MSLPPYTRIAHLEGSQTGHDDLILDARAHRALFRSRYHVYEKLDGINVAIGLGPGERLEVQVRAPWDRALDGGVSRAARIWALQRQQRLRPLLRGGAVLYGEWLWHRVSIGYTALPDRLVVIGRRTPRGWTDAELLRQRCTRLGLASLPPLWTGRPRALAELRARVGPSQLGGGRAEGLVLVRCAGRGPNLAKWVEPGHRAGRKGELDGRHNRLRS